MTTSSTVFVFDTNILLGTPNLDDVPWTRTFLVAEQGPLRLVVPEVVVSEFARRRWEDYDKAAKNGATKWGEALRSLKGAKIALPAELPSVKDLRASINARSVDEFAKDLRERLDLEGVDVQAVSERLDHATLVAWSLEQHPPFDQNDKGYRDALIWANVLDVASSAPTGADIVFVTNDKDYCGVGEHSDVLHPTLLNEVEALTSNRVRIAKTIDGAMTMTGLDAVHAEISTSDVGDLLDMPTLHDVLVSAVAGQIEEMWGTELTTEDRNTSGLVLDNFDFDSDLESPITITEITPDLDTLTYDVAEKFDGGTEIGEVRVNATIGYEGYMYKSDYAASATDWTVYDGDHNDHYMIVGDEFEAELSYQFVVNFESVDALDLQDIVPIDNGQTEHDMFSDLVAESDGNEEKS